VPQVGHHVHAPPLDLGGLRVLILVDQVLADRHRHQGKHLGLEPRLAERGQVLARVPVQHQLVRHKLERVSGLRSFLREPEFVDRPVQVAIGEHAVVKLDIVTLVQGHGSMLAGGRATGITRCEWLRPASPRSPR
jgi:hypothetical protein